MLKLALATSLFALGGCVPDDEKLMKLEEEFATIVDSNKDDCSRMASELTKLGEAKGKDFQKLKRRLTPTGAEKTKSLEARLNEKFGPRRKATRGKLVGGMKCFLSEPVARAMLLIEGDGEDQPGRAPPEKPVTGAPVAFVVDKLGAKSLDVSVYNFGDKTFGAYGLLIRYTGADGAPRKPKMAMMGRDFMHWSISGKSFRVPPRQWRSFVLDHLETPEGAVKAEVLVDSVRATDGIRIEDQATWSYNGFDWPAAHAAK